VALRLPCDLHRGELDGLILEHAPGCDVADHELDRSKDRTEGEGNSEAEAVVAIAAASEPADRVHRRHHERGRHIKSDDQMPELIAERGREDGIGHVDVDRPPLRAELETAWSVHPRVGDDHSESTQHTRGRQDRPNLKWSLGGSLFHPYR